MRRWIHRIHVIATAIVGVQLVAWVATGFAFTLFDFRVVRGVDDRAPAPALDLSTVRLSPREAADRGRAARPGVTRVESLRLKTIDGRSVYQVTLADDHGEALVDAVDGDLLAIDASTATRIATRAFRGVVGTRGVHRKDEEGRGSFLVQLDDARATEVAVDAATGDVTSWHNRTWRTFDTLWSIHVLGYVDRHSPAQWPLRLVALLATFAAGSGAALLVSRVWRRIRRRPPHLAVSSRTSIGSRVPKAT